MTDTQTQSPAVQELSLSSLAFRCSEETQRFYDRLTHDPRFCFELFRRAAGERDEHAWRILFRHYENLVIGWVRRHPAYPTSGEETAYFVNRAFERLWTALAPETFHRFKDLKSILRYLQLCVHSAIVDHGRTLKIAPEEIEGALETHQPASGETPVEANVMERSQREALWEYVGSACKDDQEHAIVYGSFVLDLKPRQLLNHYSGTFADVKEIYRVKQNVLDRLRRDPEFGKFLDGDA